MGNGKVVRLEVLGLEAPLKDNEFFHDDGYVDDVFEHIKKINLMYGYSDDFECDNLSKPRIISGAFLSRHSNREIHYHIFYTPIYHRMTRCTFSEVAIRAHEETHFLDDSGNLDILEEALNQAKVRTRLNKLSAEVKAGLGEIYALMNNGFKEEFEHLRFWRFFDFSFRKAKKFFRRRK